MRSGMIGNEGKIDLKERKGILGESEEEEERNI